MEKEDKLMKQKILQIKKMQKPIIRVWINSKNK